MRPSSTTARALLLVVALGVPALAAPADRALDAPIAVLGALDAEVQPVLAALARPQAVPVHGIPCVGGTIAGRRVLVAATGVGKVNAAMTTALVIDRFSPAAVIFTGVAGALDPELQPGDVVIGERLVQHDLVNHTESGAELRSVRSPSSGATGPIALEASPMLLTKAREAALGLQLERAAGATRAPRVRAGTIATGDSFISSRAKKTQLRDELRAHAVEMEGAAVAQVCRELGVPFLVVRGLSDRAAGEAREEARRNLGIAARNAAAAALAVVRRPSGFNGAPARSDSR